MRNLFQKLAASEAERFKVTIEPLPGASPDEKIVLEVAIGADETSVDVNVKLIEG